MKIESLNCCHPSRYCCYYHINIVSHGYDRFLSVLLSLLSYYITLYWSLCILHAFCIFFLFMLVSLVHSPTGIKSNHVRTDIAANIITMYTCAYLHTFKRLFLHLATNIYINFLACSFDLLYLCANTFFKKNYNG